MSKAIADVLIKAGPDGTANRRINDVIGNKADSAANGDPDDTTSIVGYLKQIVTSLQSIQDTLDAG